MLNTIKRLKVSYMLYNFFHRKQLKHNEPLYKSLGLKKRYFSPVSSKDFKHLPQREAAFDQTVFEQHIAALPFWESLPDQSRRSLLNFHKEGYAVLEGFFSEAEVAAANTEINQLLETGKVKFRYGNKIMFAYRKSEALRNMGQNEKLLEILKQLLDKKPILFQSINFFTGSQQKTHSDSIHMTTYPTGGLIAIWVALEDILEGSGPLHYYPRSHTLPYYLNSDYDNEGSALLIGDKNYAEYEKMIERKKQEKQLPKQVFLARKGDVFIWHANLLHGGEPHTDKSKTRRSVVFHYFSEGSICYHEITQRPALMP